LIKTFSAKKNILELQFQYWKIDQSKKLFSSLWVTSFWRKEFTYWEKKLWWSMTKTNLEWKRGAVKFGIKLEECCSLSFKIMMPQIFNAFETLSTTATYLLFSSLTKKRRCQFHQHFMRAFFEKFWRQKLQSFVLALRLLAPKFHTKNARVKCWWNWQLNFEFKSCWKFTLIKPKHLLSYNMKCSLILKILPFLRKHS